MGTGMERARLRQRWREMEQGLGDLYEGRVQHGDPIEREGALLPEDDEIEFLVGEEWLRHRR